MPSKTVPCPMISRNAPSTVKLSAIPNPIEKNIKIKVVDPAVEIVERATQTLTTLNLLNDKKEKGKVIFFVTGETYHFKPTAEKFLGKEIEIYRIPK